MPTCIPPKLKMNLAASCNLMFTVPIDYALDKHCGQYEFN